MGPVASSSFQVTGTLLVSGPQTPPAQMGTLGVKPTTGIIKENGKKQGWQKNGWSSFLCPTGIHYPVTAASRGALNTITSTFLLFLSQLEEQPWKTSHCWHAKANSAVKQTPGTRALTGSLVYWRGTPMPAQQTQLCYIFITGHFSSFH